MADRRAIKSNIWDDEFFGSELSLLGKLVWIGIFSKCADNQGRMLDNATLIRSSLFPYGDATSDDVEQCLENFEEKIIRYESHGKKYIQIKKWWENQPLQYAVPSNFPAPEGWKDRVRTTYKGKKIIYNWDGQPDNELGIMLMNKLESLGRVSSWIDYLDTLNLNLNLNLNPNSNSNKKAAPQPENFPEPSEMSIWFNVTGMSAFPIKSDKSDLIGLLRTIQAHKKEQTVSYLRSVFQEWTSRGYSKLNPSWLDWAISGEIPPKKEKVDNPRNFHNQKFKQPKPGKNPEPQYTPEQLIAALAMESDP